MRHYWLVLWEAPNGTVQKTTTRLRRREIAQWITIWVEKKLLALTRITKKEAILLGYKA